MELDDGTGDGCAVFGIPIGLVVLVILAILTSVL
jgi:hypothetical protein